MATYLTTYHQINHLNIRHIHSYTPEPIVRRKRVPNKIVAAREEESREKFQRRFRVENRIMEYHPGFKIILPRAPAFRGATEDQIDTIVERLYRPKTPRIITSSMLDSRESKSGTPCSGTGSYVSSNTTQTQGRRPKSCKDIDTISQRLYSSHTQMSRMRSAR